MGLYSTVFASFACESCGADFRTDVQFYTDDDGGLPQYEVGEVVAALKPASTYEGIADAFCAPCMARWQADENEANFEALETAIGAGEIVARFATYQVARARLADGPVLTILREAPLTPTEARGSFATARGSRAPRNRGGRCTAHGLGGTLRKRGGGPRQEPGPVTWSYSSGATEESTSNRSGSAPAHA
jgi:hypothetical protein